MILLRARKRLYLAVSQEQSDILVGTILGDAYIEKRGKFQIEQSASQERYLEWKYAKLQSISYGPPKRVERIDKRNGRRTVSYRFWTRQFFRGWRERFYRDGRKIIPPDLTILSPLSMAVWYMDDGSLDDHRRIILSTESFDEENLARAQQLLQDSFNIETYVKGNGKLLVGTREAKKLLACMRPWVIPSMAYKFP